jgi:hypothetical protein
MAYVTRPALVPADFGFPLEKVDQKSKEKTPKPKVSKPKVSKKTKKVVKKVVPKVSKKGRSLPWKV